MTAFPFALDALEHADALPDEADVVVIGGGVIGVTAALDLARQGQRVVLLEKGRIAGEQSSRNWGWIRAQGRDFGELPIALEAQRLWAELAPELDRDIGLTQGGTVYFAQTEAELARYSDWLDTARTFQVSTRLLTGREAQALIPAARAEWLGALWTPTDYRAEPWLAVPALARLARASGATVIERCAVRALDMAAGQVAGVVTERGRIAAPRVILAGGAWSALFLRNAGLSIPQLTVRATVTRTAPLPEVFAGGAIAGDLAFRRRADGGYTLTHGVDHDHFLGPDSFRHRRVFAPLHARDRASTRLKPWAPRGWPDAWGTPRRWSADTETPFERMRILNPAPNARTVAEVPGRMQALLPGIGEVRVTDAWAGMIDVMPDEVPVVDTCEDMPGLVIATGMCGHGFGIGPAFGRIAAALATGRDTGHDLRRFRLSRFFDGSPLEVPAGP